MNMVDMSRRSLTYESRLLKYAKRGNQSLLLLLSLLLSLSSSIIIHQEQETF
jgi:hypothetical protein